MADKTTYEKEMLRFTGTEAYHRSIMSDVVLTDGVKWVHDNGLAEVVNIIATRQTEVVKANKRMKQFQVWTLTRVPTRETDPRAAASDFTWRLTAGTGARNSKSVCEDRLATLPRFPLECIQFYVQPNSAGKGVIMLPFER